MFLLLQIGTVYLGVVVSGVLLFGLGVVVFLGGLYVYLWDGGVDDGVDSCN